MIAGGSGNFFLHITEDKGLHWKSPFTVFADTLPREKNKKWESSGIEVTSIRHLEFHPASPLIAYAAAYDIGGLVTEDGGSTWRIISADYNSNYDYAFDPANDNIVFAATGFNS